MLTDKYIFKMKIMIYNIILNLFPKSYKFIREKLKLFTNIIYNQILVIFDYIKLILLVIVLKYINLILLIRVFENVYLCTIIETYIQVVVILY